MKSKSQSSMRFLSILFRIEPRYFLFAFPNLILTSLTPLIHIFFPKTFIEQLSAGNSYIEISRTVIVYAGILLVTGLLNVFIKNKKNMIIQSITKKIQLETGTITMNMPLSEVEGAEYNKKLILANRVTEILKVEDIFFDIVSSILTIAGLTAIIIRLDLLFIILILIALWFKVLFVYLTYRHNQKRRIAYAENDRKGNYLDKVAYFHKGLAKELRVNSLKNWFMCKVKGYRSIMLNMQYKDFKKYTLFECISAVLTTLQSFVILTALALKSVNGIISTADFTMFFSAITILTLKLSNIIKSIGEFHKIQLNISDYESLLAGAKEKEKTITEKIKFGEIVFDHVSFSYPGSNKLVLQNVNLVIHPGEKISIVGENGAGKSTLIKLLCRFYKPTQGKILINGIDIFSVADEEYNKLISAVFQDYQIFAFSIRENVSMGNNEGQEKTVLSDVGLEELIEKMPMGENTCLSKLFDPHGVDLSGGESQKLAIARALYKSTPLLILDEPTASLDPKAEREIYESFFRIARTKTTIFISHRLASSTVADRIIVLKNGQLVECGNHKELLARNQEYAKMFRLQSEAYVRAF